MTIDELISELQRVKDTYGDMEVRVTTNNPINYHKEFVSKDKPTMYHLLWPGTVTLDKSDFVVTDRTPDGPDLTCDNTRYLSLGDFSIQGLNKSDLMDVAEKYHASRCGMCRLLEKTLYYEREENRCLECQQRGPLSQLPYYSKREYYCSACPYTYPTGEERQDLPSPFNF